MTRSIRSAVLSLVLAVSGILGLQAVTAGPASAATTTTYTSYCFKHTNGSAYTNNPVYAQVYWNGQWVNIGSATSNLAGCGAFWMPANRYVRVMAYLRLPNYVFQGFTNWGTTPYYGGGSLNLGTGWVNS
jgi:hypothetical protein